MAHCAIGRSSELENCPLNTSADLFDRVRKIYSDQKDVLLATKNASIVEATGYLKWPRLKDTIEYAKLMGYKKIGIAYCVGLMKEAKKVAEILEKYGFEVNSVCCKTGCFKKTDVGVPEEFIMRAKTGYLIGLITCNPVGQALLLNEAKTEMNIICGLCVGHDITFTRFSEAPVTTLIAKDRVTIHNPAAVLYSYYGETFFAEDLRKQKTV